MSNIVQINWGLAHVYILQWQSIVTLGGPTDFGLNLGFMLIVLNEVGFCVKEAPKMLYETVPTSGGGNFHPIANQKH